MISIKNIIISFLLILFLVVTSLGTWIYSQIDSALPVLEGKRTLLGLSDTAVVERDKQGIVTIKAKKRNDIAVATGFIHAQERFFQMDLLRRNSAGELASLFGEKALPHDKEIRRHRFRERARVIVSQLPAKDLALLKAYTRGVNQGISNLKSPPFEYLLLQHEKTCSWTTLQNQSVCVYADKLCPWHLDACCANKSVHTSSCQVRFGFIRDHRAINAAGQNGYLQRLDGQSCFL